MIRLWLLSPGFHGLLQRHLRLVVVRGEVVKADRLAVFFAVHIGHDGSNQCPGTLYSHSRVEASPLAPVFGPFQKLDIAHRMFGYRDRRTANAAHH